jgi:hypothetical protein
VWSAIVKECGVLIFLISFVDQLSITMHGSEKALKLKEKFMVEVSTLLPSITKPDLHTLYPADLPYNFQDLP